jgi:hypothetical protein
MTFWDKILKVKWTLIWDEGSRTSCGSKYITRNFTLNYLHYLEIVPHFKIYYYITTIQLLVA